MDLGISSDEEMEMAIADQLLPKPRRARHFKERAFDEAIDEPTRRQQHRVPLAVVDYLEETIGHLLQHPTKRNKPLTPRQQIETFLQYLGNNPYYHLLRDARGPSTNTICAVIHRVSKAVNTLKDEVIKWPDNCSRLAQDFMKIAGFPKVAGCVDGTHVNISVPSKDEYSYLNRHQLHSINVLAVAGPDLSIYYLYADKPGRCHDSNVLKSSLLWRSMEVIGNRPFDGAVILGDSAYPLLQWLITPIPGDHPPNSAKGRFNVAHLKTRNIVERSFGVMKNGFSVLKSTIRLQDPLESSNIIVSATILHNLCIRYGDHGEDLSDDDQEEGEEHQVDPDDPPEPDEQGGPLRERRRNQLLNTFQ
jgi:hypothetical protein